MGDLRDKVTQLRCASWRELVNAFDDLSYEKSIATDHHWVYRGQSSAAWWLKPSIELFRESLRAPRRKYLIRELEQQLLYDFKNSASQFLTNLPDSVDHWEWLAILQHHGAPTRLLDWTFSPTVAAHFALRSHPGAKVDREACIWAVNVTMLRHHIERITGEPDWTVAYGKALQDARDDSGGACVIPYLPNNRYSRMSGQQGLFLLKTVTEKPFMSVLDSMNSLDDASFIKRLIIPHDARINILSHLLEHNTHEVAIFPDADGLGRFVKTKVEVQAQTLGLR